MFVTDSIEINTPPAVVWKALVDERQFYKTEVSSVIGNSYVIHQEFPTPLGPVKVAFMMFDQPFKRMDFLLIESEQVKELKGDWTLTPTKTGTRLNLHIDKLKPCIFIPAGIVRKVFLSISHRRLERIKTRAESQ